VADKEDMIYSFVLRGYDVIVTPSDKGPDFYYVSVLEGSKPVFEDDVSLSEFNNKQMVYQNDCEFAANVAVDMLESSQNRLGEGARVAMKKVSCIWDLEKVIAKAKGTLFESKVFELADNSLQLESKYLKLKAKSDQLNDALDALMLDLDKLNVDRLKESPKSQTVIVIQSHHYAINAEGLTETLRKFRGCKYERQAEQIIKEVIKLEKEISDIDFNWYFDGIQNIEKELGDIELMMLERELVDQGLPDVTEVSEPEPNDWLGLAEEAFSGMEDSNKDLRWGL
jgi:hypothetical protein